MELGQGDARNLDKRHRGALQALGKYIEFTVILPNRGRQEHSVESATGKVRDDAPVSQALKTGLVVPEGQCEPEGLMTFRRGNKYAAEVYAIKVLAKEWQEVEIGMFGKVETETSLEKASTAGQDGE
jgi:hypothetical protein